MFMYVLFEIVENSEIWIGVSKIMNCDDEWLNGKF